MPAEILPAKRQYDVHPPSKTHWLTRFYTAYDVSLYVFLNFDDNLNATDCIYTFVFGGVQSKPFCSEFICE
jgi:hypothetical protein